MGRKGRRRGRTFSIENLPRSGNKQEAGEASFGAAKVRIDNGDIVKEGWKGLGRTGAHEAGHVGGLSHPVDSKKVEITEDTGNLMQQSQYSNGTAITQKQVETMYNKTNPEKRDQ